MAMTSHLPARVLGLEPYSRLGNLMGGLLMAASMSLFVTNDSIMRGLQQEDNPFGTETLPLPMIIALRGTLVVIFLVALALAVRQPVFSLAMLHRWNSARAITEATITFLFLASLPFLPFAVAETIISSNPIFLVFLGILLFGERVGWRRWLAIAIGFVGIIMASFAMDHGEFDTANFRWWAIPACLMAAVLVAFRDVFTRYVGEALPPVTVALSSAMAVMTLGWIVGLSDFVTPNGSQLLLLLASAVLVSGAYLSAVFAVRLGVFAVVGPLRFVSLVVAFAIGILFFREPFSWMGFIGAVLIVGSAVWILLRQHRLQSDSD